MNFRVRVCQVVLLTWWAVFRDSLYYILSVVALIAVSPAANTNTGLSVFKKYLKTQLTVVNDLYT